MALCPVVVTPCIGDHLYCKQPAENSEFQQENENACKMSRNQQYYSQSIRTQMNFGRCAEMITPWIGDHLYCKQPTENSEFQQENCIADGHYERYNHKTDMISSGLSLAATMPTQSKRDLIKRSVRKFEWTFLQGKQQFLEEAMKTSIEEGLEVHMFEGKGRGVVATCCFSRRDFVLEYKGELITMREAKEREEIYSKEENIGCYMYYFKYNSVHYCIDATSDSDWLGRLVNHSKNGNLLPKILVVDNEPHIIFVAKQDIKPGEEITFDYGDRDKESLKYHPWLAM